MHREPWTIGFVGGLRIAVVRTGPGALIFYQGFSEPDTAEFVGRFLRPGMTVIDVGAYVGEYTLLSARLVGPPGHVHAFEPNPALFHLLSHNVTANGLTNVTVNEAAVAEADGDAVLDIPEEAALASLRPAGAAAGVAGSRVRTVRLDDYVAGRGLGSVDLIKVDVEGAERRVFDGARDLMMAEPALAPVLLFEHAPHNYARHGYAPEAVFATLRSHGYSIFLARRGGALAPVEPDTVPEGTINLVAGKDADRLNALHGS